MKAHYQSYCYGVELCKAEGQSIVECRMAAGDIGGIVDVEAHAALLQASCESGEVKYGGKLFLTVLYTDSEGKLCRAERGAEFFHRAEHSGVTPACSAQGELSIERVDTRRDGASIVVACVVGGRFSVFGERCMEYLTGGEGLIVDAEDVLLGKVYTANTAFEEADEFETDYAQDILLHGESVIVTDVRADMGVVDVGGEIALHFCMQRRDGSLCTYERTVPFKAQVLCDGATPSSTATAKVAVQSAYLTADTDEERGRSKIAVDFTLTAAVCVYEKEELSVGRDAFSTECFLSLKQQKEATMYALNGENRTERIHGVPVLEGLNSMAGKTPCAVVSPSASVRLCQGEQGVEVEGVIEGKVLYQNEGGGYGCVKMQLPFLFPFSAALDSELSCSVCGLSVRLRASGELEAEGTLKMRVTPYERLGVSCICEAAEGEQRPKQCAGISVYMTERGDGLWETAKRLCVPPEQLREENPSLCFPLKGEERLVIYRQNAQISQK